MAKKKDDEELEGLSIGQTEEEFFKRKDLLQKKARIYVEIPEEKGYDEKGEEIVMYPTKTIEVQPYYWNAILRDKNTGKPQKKQNLVSYKIEEEGQMKTYQFKK